jgi:hypothetical protein
MALLNADLIGCIFLYLTLDDIKNIPNQLIPHTIANKILNNVQFWLKKIYFDFEIVCSNQPSSRWYYDFYGFLVNSISLPILTTFDNLILSNNVEYFKLMMFKHGVQSQILTDVLKSAVGKGTSTFIKILIEDGRAEINESIDVGIDNSVPLAVVSSNTISFKYFLDDTRLNISYSIGLDILHKLIIDTNLENFKLIFEDTRLDITSAIDKLNILIKSATNRDTPLSYEQHLKRLTRNAPQVNHEKMCKFAKKVTNRDKNLSRNNSIEIFKLIVNDVRFINLVDNNLLEILTKQSDKDKLNIVVNRLKEIQK